MAMSNGLDESESDAQRDHSRAARLLRGTRYKCATGWRLLERILFLLCGKSRWLLYHRRFLWQVVMAALGSRGAKSIPSLEGRGFLWQFCKGAACASTEPTHKQTLSPAEVRSRSLERGARTGLYLPCDRRW